MGILILGANVTEKNGCKDRDQQNFQMCRQ